MIRVQFLLFFVFIFSANTFTQSCFEQIDAEIRLVLTIEATNTKGVTLGQAYEYISRVNFHVDTLETIGFQEYWFLNVRLVRRPKEGTTNIPILGSNCDGYIVALRKNGGLIHRINGFRQNDLSAIFSNSNGNPIRKRKFLRTHRIKGLDLVCLYNAWKANSNDTDKYPCLQSCLNQMVIR